MSVIHPRNAVAIAAILFSNLALLRGGQPPETRGGIRGRCAIAETGEPLAKVNVKLLAVIDGRQIERAAASGPDGAFSFENLPAGVYWLRAEPTGYHEAEGSSGPVSLARNQTRTGVEILFHRSAVIKGQVRQADGSPVAGAQLTAYGFEWSAGRASLFSAGSASADGRGNYRLAQLPAGLYLLGVSPPAGSKPGGAIPIPSMYYQNAGGPADALRLKLRWGQELGEANFELGPQRTFEIQGVVTDAPTGGPCGSCTASITHVDGVYQLSHPSFRVPAAGRYLIRGLTAGTYRLSAEKGDAAGRRKTWSRTVQITDKSLEDVNLSVGSELTVSGRLAPADSSAVIDASRVEIEFVPPGEMEGSETVRLRADRSFEVRLPAGSYRVHVDGLPAGGYLKTVRRAGADLRLPELEVPEGAGVSDLEIVAAFDSGTISGTVRDTARNSHPIGSVIVALFPQDNESGFLLERRSHTDLTGRFALASVAPGKYGIVALPRKGVLALGDPELWQRLRNHVRSIELRPGSRQTVELALPRPSDLE